MGVGENLLQHQASHHLVSRVLNRDDRQDVWASCGALQRRVQGHCVVVVVPHVVVRLTVAVLAKQQAVMIDLDLGRVVHREREDRLSGRDFEVGAQEGRDGRRTDLVDGNNVCVASVAIDIQRGIGRERDRAVQSARGTGDVVVADALNFQQAIAEDHQRVVSCVAVLKNGRARRVRQSGRRVDGRADNVVLATVEDRRTNVAHVLASFAAQIGERGDGRELARLANAVLEASGAVEPELDVAVEVAVVVGEVVDDLTQRFVSDLCLLKITNDIFKLGLNLV